MQRESRYSVSSSRSASPSKQGYATRRPSSKAGGDTVSDSPASSKRASDVGQRPEGERVRVFVRVRPTRAEETPGGLKVKAGGTGVVVYREHASIPVSDWEFDRVLPPSATQSDVYQAAVRPIVEDVLNGYNGTVMAYGQTGAGKTHTLSSIKPDAIGMIPRAAAEVFSAIAADPGHEYSVALSYVQIYMELIQDLLRPESENLQIREAEGGGVFISGVQQVEVASIEQCLHLLQLGDRNRATAFTALNAHSSRSHAVVMLTVVKRKSVAGTGDAEIQRVKVGKLFMVDLAGSERLKKSKSTGLRATEAKSINLSLTTLGMCINARADPNATHVPFRDSKLTRLLQESLGGNAKTSLVIAVSDATEHVDETQQSLLFGVRAMCVKIQAVVNERVDYKSLHADLVAALEGQDQKSALLERSLLAKESELESMHAQLREEKEANKRIIGALQKEREEAEAEKDRLLQEREVQLEAEQQHRQSLLVQLEETQVHTEGLRQAHVAQRVELETQLATVQAQLAEAALAAQEAAVQHELALGEAAAEARRERAKLQAQHEAALAQSAAAHAAELAALAVAQQAEQAAAADAHAAQVAALQQEVAAREERVGQLEAQLAQALEDAEEQRAQAQLRTEEREAAVAELREEVAARDDTIVQLHDTISGLEAGTAELEVQRQQLARSLDSLEQHRQALEEDLAGERQRIAQYQAQLEAYERSRMNLAKSFFENRRLNDAARLIQRAFRDHRNRRLKAAQAQRQQALQEAHSALGSLEAQRAELERRRRANLAFSGQTLVGDSLGVLQDAVEGLITAFLLPARDLRTLQTVKQRVSHYGGGGGGAKNPLLMASLAGSVGGGGGGLSRHSSNPDLIKAVNPLAASVGMFGGGLAAGEEGAGQRSGGSFAARMFSISSPFRKQQLPQQGAGQQPYFPSGLRPQ